MTFPWFAQLPVWIWAGCMLLGANPTSETFTVKSWVAGSQVRSAVPLGTCFSVAVARLAVIVGIGGPLGALVAGAALVGVGAGGLLAAPPPHPASSSAATMHSTASMLVFRCLSLEEIVTMTIPFVHYVCSC